MNKCLDCKFFLSANGFRDKFDSMPGECRRHAPVTSIEQNARPKWPAVKPSYGCGDFEYEPLANDGYDRRPGADHGPRP